jgi:hypothetical protein
MIVSVVIDNIEIEKHYIEIFERFLGGELLLSGKALEEEGKKIYDKLTDYRKGDDGAQVALKLLDQALKPTHNQF